MSKIELCLTDYEKLVRDNERMKTALQNIRYYAQEAVWGGWRHFVYEQAAFGLLSR
jgi:hypothetical protein